ncbi:TetR/AcrR family transcriptional regulator [Arenivirga flava]|uniref:TetR family transcriptional regulator n=1 Tax=Arenivirga flava TaxID=1930060 RepID=A0AA37XBU3_9MICO|nr:TetR/AcrR family transcriptional regulator [Arenivirga flava]GMA29101.1 TetR family transcriptional regulator [Arenivirga flava]
MTTTGKRGPYRGTAARRREIVDAAAEVFGESGYRAGSLKDIAGRVGIDASSLLHHFGSKHVLLEAVLADKVSRDAQALHWDEEIEPAEFPAALIRLAERNAANPGVIGLYTVLLAESTTVDHPSADFFRDRHATTRRDFLRGFDAMAEAGLLAEDVTPQEAALSTLAIWDGAQTQWLLDPGAIEVVAVLRGHFRRITRVEV